LAHVIANVSEAIQISLRYTALDCFVAILPDDDDDVSAPEGKL
jgi:hypothetical protein